MVPSDPEGFLVKIGSNILIGLTLMRFILYEYINLREDFKRWTTVAQINPLNLD
jgi:hypothetical protein